MNRSAKDNLTDVPLYEAQPMSGAEGNAAIWENASNREIINLRKHFPESTFFQAIKQRRATAGERWPGEKQVNAHFADECSLCRRGCRLRFGLFRLERDRKFPRRLGRSRTRRPEKKESDHSQSDPHRSETR
jgi:hypothetical protein